MDFSDGDESLTFTVAVDGGTAQTVTIDQAAVAAAGNSDNVIDDVDALVEIVGAQLTDVTVGNDGGAISFTSDSQGASSSIDITAPVAAGTGFTNTSGIGAANVTGSDASTTGGTTVAKSVDELVNEINNDASLKTKIKASNDNGKLRIQNLSTQDLSIDGVTSAGVIDGSSTGAMSVDGNKVRADLAKQFNDLRDQLDKYADDASFNGINLLRGDLLKLT